MILSTYQKGLVALMAGCLYFFIDAQQVPASYMQDSLVLFCLDKNVVRIERYQLSDVRADMNYFSADMYEKLSVGALDMGERGSHVHELQMLPQEPHKLKIVVRNGNKFNTYIFEWLEMVGKGQIPLGHLVYVDCDAYLRGSKREYIRNGEPLEVCDAFCREGIAKDDKRWLSLVGTSWNLNDTLYSTYFVFDRCIKSACGVIVPGEYDLKNTNNSSVIAKKTALNNGLMWLQQEEHGLEDEDVLVLSESEDDELQKNTAESSEAVTVDTLEQTLQPTEPAEQNMSWFDQVMSFVYNLFSWKQ